LKPTTWGSWANAEPLKLTEDERQLTGRALAGALIQRSDQRCEDYLIGVTAQRNGANGLLSILANGLGVAGGLASHAQAANAFSVVSTFTNTSARTLNDTIFAGRDTSLIYEAVKKGRDRERAVLFATMDQFTDTMPSREVVARIAPYDLNCGITYGMVELHGALRKDASAPPSGDRPQGRPSEASAH
jgi:hypothetical protein